MAGRGVDIKLGGNEEHLTQRELVQRGLEPDSDDWNNAWDEVFPKMEQQVVDDREKVMASGGLFICGTERHESRRIDNQLRGRSGRQGDPGESRFYLSAEDDLVRLFAGDRIYRILDNKFLAQADDDGNEMPIEHKMLSKQIENAQKKVEEQNFLIRKRVLEYDDVMNQQREIVYEYRDRILEGEDMSEIARTQIADAIERLCGEYLQGEYQEDWELDRLLEQLGQIYAVSYEADDVEERETRSTLVEKLREDVVEAYDDREEELGSELMRALERFMLLQIIDERWREHLHDMDYLREGIHLRGFAQIDPLVAYKNEGFDMFTELMNNIWDEFARYVFNVEVEAQPEQPRPPAAATAALGRGRQRLGVEHRLALLVRRRHRRRAAERARGGRGTGRRGPARGRGRSGRVRGGVGARAAPRDRDARCSTSTSESAATTHAGAAPARSSRSAMVRRNERRRQWPPRPAEAARGLPLTPLA